MNGDVIMVKGERWEENIWCRITTKLERLLKNSKSTHPTQNTH